MTTKHGGPIRLTDENKEHLGFILMAGDGYPLDADFFEGDCIFIPLPHTPALFESEPFLLLAEHKDAGEHRYRLTRDGTTLQFTISGPLERQIFLTVHQDGWGDWGIRLGTREQRMGYSHRVKADARE